VSNISDLSDKRKAGDDAANHGLGKNRAQAEAESDAAERNRRLCGVERSERSRAEIVGVMNRRAEKWRPDVAPGETDDLLSVVIERLTIFYASAEKKKKKKKKKTRQSNRKAWRWLFDVKR